jgi:ABC-type sugar transport system permease subunit
MDNKGKLEFVRHAQPAAAVVSSGHRAVPSRSRVLFRKLEPYLYLLPGLLLVGGLLHYSVLQTFGVSFTNWNLISPPEFTGIDNYINVVRDPTFVRSLTNTLMWTGGSLLLPVAGGLILAVFLERIPGQRVIKVMIYLPATLAATVVAVIWSYVYSNNGVLNEGLRWFGLDSLTQPWLVHAPTNTLAMIVTSTWRLLGPSIILFLVGLQTIPTELIEAAKIDGAGGWTLFRRMKLPLLRPITTVVVTMSVINSFTTFDLVWIMTQGGPGRSSETLAVTMYRQAFVMWNMGYAAAVAVILSSIVLVFSITYLRTTFKRHA